MTSWHSLVGEVRDFSQLERLWGRYVRSWNLCLEKGLDDSEDASIARRWFEGEEWDSRVREYGVETLAISLYRMHNSPTPLSKNADLAAFRIPEGMFTVHARGWVAIGRKASFETKPPLLEDRFEQLVALRDMNGCWFVAGLE